MILSSGGPVLKNVMNARALALLDDGATREYRAILRLIGERQCDSLGDFAMAEHLRGVLMEQDAPQMIRRSTPRLARES
jgi:hypothetical protein